MMKGNTFSDKPTKGLREEFTYKYRNETTKNARMRRISLGDTVSTKVSTNVQKHQEKKRKRKEKQGGCLRAVRA